MSNYTFRPADKHEVPVVFELIMARVRWMDEVGIRQWNVTDYAGCYPLTHYAAARQRGDLFVLADERDRIIACAVLRQEDERWPAAMQAAEPAFYLHHLASRAGEKGAGRIFLQMAEEYAVRQGKTRFRLDSADDNDFLTGYYTDLGYVPVGRCVDGLYSGILREKVLPLGRQAILAHLDALGVPYEITEHKAVFHMEDLKEVEIPYPEADAKNLFLRDDKKRHYYLLTVQGERQVDLKNFRRQLGTRPLSFASAEELAALLGLTPGAVTPLGLLNDHECRVTLCIDSFFAGGLVGVHPNDNTATLWLRTADLIRVIGAHGNAVQLVDL